jgi:hypothetical protein
MKTRRFRPVAGDTLEDRLVMTITIPPGLLFLVPTAMITIPPGLVYSGPTTTFVIPPGRVLYAPTIPPNSSFVPVKPTSFHVSHRVDAQAHAAVASAFDRFGREYLASRSSFTKGISKPGADTPDLVVNF